MRFPLRLSAELSFRLAANFFLASRDRNLIARLDPAELSKSDGCALSDVLRAPAPVIWIAGSDPLAHPELPRVTRELIAARRFVFLPAAAADLARRIHEFQPVSRLFWVVPFDCCEDSSSMEALRRVKLSGFFTCAHTQVCAESKLADLSGLRQHLQTLGADGWVISADHGACESTLLHARLRQKVEQAKEFIPSWGWRLFSGLLGDVGPQTQSSAMHAKKRPSPPVSEEDNSTFQESVGAP